ncbi:hypothetical protein G7068_11930 [Leucobacter viscericola]|uniref:Uncharacterized protein n=1 Tax=Leucobacter viscericola TaxID=2714935 RepID=A0A6G7XHH2_9MICO|nr:hypothetical protein [Leucobacter viscericola]QIK63818.1 hypothetical protein G7068_11930 [Leucobacter viscericola]
MATERDMLNLLGKRYTSIRPGALADRWVRAEHVRRTLGDRFGNYIADFMALDKWPGIPYGSSMAVHWHEVKVSRSDWLAELREARAAIERVRALHHVPVEPSRDRRFSHRDEECVSCGELAPCSTVRAVDAS